MHVWAASYLYMHVHPFLLNLLSLSSVFVRLADYAISVFGGGFWVIRFTFIVFSGTAFAGSRSVLIGNTP